MLTLFDKQVQLRMGQANVKRWAADIMPLLTDDDPLGVEEFATHRLPLEQGRHGYEIFQKKEGAPRTASTGTARTGLRRSRKPAPPPPRSSAA